jgi:formylglycine-generating enzyme required for sulfatase activity
VGHGRANPFGLHDVLGNVMEWCLEVAPPWTPVFRFPARAGDGLRMFPADTWEPILRGAGWQHVPYHARASYRCGSLPNQACAGVRPVRPLDPPGRRGT